MKTILKGLLFATALIIAALPPAAFSDSPPPSATPQLHPLDTFIEEITQKREAAVKEVEAAKSELNKLQAATSPKSAEKIINQQKKLDALQITAEAAQQRLDTLNKARVALSDQDPVDMVIEEFKTRLDKLPADGTESQLEQRAAIQAKLKKLETIDTVGVEATLCWIVVVALVFIALILAFLYLWKSGKKSKDRDKSDTNNVAANVVAARVWLAELVTLGALVLIFLVSVLTLLFAGIKAALAPDTENMKLFFEIAKWILATVLPVVAAWVGGVMAYYFGKENFRAGAENAEKLVRELKQTPSAKAGSFKGG
ncbi:MAG: hypothetical protein WCH01_19855 [Methylococcaceae bacterium]